MKVSLMVALFLLSAHARAETTCLAFMKNSQGGSAGSFPGQVIKEAEKELWSFDDISVTVYPPNENSPNIAVSIVNDGRKQLMVGENVWMSGEFLSKSQEAYWILIDCEQKGEKGRRR